MKKYLMAAVALICMTMTCVVFTACNKDNDETEIVKYKAEPETCNILGALVCSEMDKALSSTFGSDVAYIRDDNKAIRVCDEVANKVREQSLIKTINLKVTFAHSDPEATGKTLIVKTYTFPF